MTEVEWRGKDKADCPCGCGKFGMPLKGRSGHIRGCPCKPCLAGRNSGGGKRRHRALARAVGAATPGRGASSQEESWVHPWRVEAKTGKQVWSLVTVFVDARNQSEQSRALGDSSPFALLADCGRKGYPRVAVIDLETFNAINAELGELRRGVA